MLKLRYMILLTLGLALLSLFVGVSRITPMDLLSINSEEMEIFLISRVPRLVAILLAGAVEMKKS